jgi:hypothetical protein
MFKNKELHLVEHKIKGNSMVPIHLKLEDRYVWYVPINELAPINEYGKMHNCIDIK